jgi:hypothetical protein
MRFGVKGVFLVGFDDKICHGFGIKVRLSLVPFFKGSSSGSAMPHTQNFQKKKGKKRKPLGQVEGFSKTGFFDKILPDKVEILTKTRRA